MDEPAPTPYAPPASGSVTVYRGGTLIDGTQSAPRPRTTVVVDGAVIASVGPDEQLATPEGAQVVDLAGRFVIPGLIDSHQHLATPPNRPVAEAALRRQVYSGVTAIRDMADDLRQIGDLARATRVGEIAGPDIHYAALMAGPGFFDDPRTWQVSQGETPGHVPWMQAVDQGTDLPLAVAMARGTHATAIKVYADLPGETVAAVVAEAHRQGIQVWAHAAVFPASPAEVIDAGVDAVSHVTLLAQQTADEPLSSYKTKPLLDIERLIESGDPRLDALYAELGRRGTVLDATAGMWLWVADQADDAEAKERALANDRLSAKLTADAFRAGVPISAGTDYENDPAEPLPALHSELAYLVNRCGIPAADAIRSATAIGAASMGASDVMGTVEPGKLANFVVLAADPIADISRLGQVVFTVKRGRRFDRDSFFSVEGRA
ncbi:MAG: amidohydrolase family protein [Hamadaea sp.]|uniref:amidohydrolase family protein n=1 Tax=Hamadaea sp. TaxID=2024425 RepID=UPI00181CA160|nr:amidohydrolase family protein [Hamadaea sp.]NUT18743.1 amidohydrolase family protein [Hamadaea sp.]